MSKAFGEKEFVYQIKCRDCQNSFIGKTGNNLKTLIKENKTDIHQGKLFIQSYQHNQESDQNFDFDNVCI